MSKHKTASGKTVHGFWYRATPQDRRTALTEINILQKHNKALLHPCGVCHQAVVGKSWVYSMQNQACHQVAHAVCVKPDFVPPVAPVSAPTIEERLVALEMLAEVRLSRIEHLERRVESLEVIGEQRLRRLEDCKDYLWRELGIKVYL